MLHAILAIVAAIMVGATLCAACKPGEAENICKYGHEEH